MPDPLGPARYLALGEAVLRSARAVPDRVALRCGDAVLTYAGLAERSLALGGAMQERGIVAGDRVAVAMHNRLEVVESYLACHLIGACAVPLNFRLATAEMKYQLHHSGARLVLADAELHDAAEQLADGQRVLSLTGSYQAAIAGATPAEQAPVREDDLAFVIYTSGTTGIAKGAMLTHRNLMANTTNWIMTVGATRSDVWLSGLPLFHIGGINGVLPFLYLGGTAIITPSTAFDALAAMAQLRDHEVTMCFFVPTQWQQVCAVVDGAPPASLRIAMWGGSQSPLATLEQMTATFPGVGIINAFGQTEMSSNTCMLMPADAVRKIGSVGRPVVGVEARVVDEEMRDVGVDEVGEIVYRGPTVMAGYLDNPEASAQAMRGGWFHSGDLVRRDAEGYLYVVDRRTDMIVSGGENIYPAEVERVLLADARIADAAVVGVPHPRWVQAPVAVVVRADGVPGAAGLDEAAVIEVARAGLASYKKPQAVVFVDELPRNAAGKVLRRALRDDLAGTFTPSNDVTKGTEHGRSDTVG